MHTDEEDSDFDMALHLRRKELLQQLLALLSSAVVLKPHTAAHPQRENQPRGPPKHR